MLQLLDSIEDYLMVVDSFLRGRILFDVKTLCLRLRGVGDGWAGWAIAHPGFGRSVWCGICSSFFLSFSRSQVVNFLKWLSENNAIFHSNDNFSTQYLFKQKKVSFDDFFMTTWEQENKTKEKKEPQTLSNCHYSDEINHLLNAFRRKRKKLGEITESGNLCPINTVNWIHYMRSSLLFDDCRKSS